MDSVTFANKLAEIYAACFKWITKEEGGHTDSYEIISATKWGVNLRSTFVDTTCDDLGHSIYFVSYKELGIKF